MSLMKHKVIRPVPAHSAPAAGMAHRHCGAVQPRVWRQCSSKQTLLEAFSIPETKPREAHGEGAFALCVSISACSVSDHSSPVDCTLRVSLGLLQLHGLVQTRCSFSPFIGTNFLKVEKSCFAGNKLDNVNLSKVHKSWIIKNCICHCFITNIMIINY